MASANSAETTGSWASSEGRRRTMQGSRSRDTQPELAVRRILHARGLRYRVSVAPIPGLRRTADLTFSREKVAVFLDGCFWHACPEHGRKAFSYNSNYWTTKLRANVDRDADTTARFEAAGWVVLRFWEHESPVDVADAIEERVRSRKDRS